MASSSSFSRSNAVDSGSGGICRQFDCVRRTVITRSTSKANPGRLYHRCSIHGWSSWCTQGEENAYNTDHTLEEERVDQADPNGSVQGRIEDHYMGLRQLIAINLVLLAMYLFCLIMKCIF